MKSKMVKVDYLVLVREGTGRLRFFASLAYIGL